jgi:hypothetical protein
MNHPVKRYKLNDEKKPNSSQPNNNDLFPGQQPHPSQQQSSNAHQQQLLQASSSHDDSKHGIVNGIGETKIKSELPDDDDENHRGNKMAGGGGAESVTIGPDGEPIINANEIKKEMSDDERDKFQTNLFTNEGLQPSYKDLDQIFDNSDDNMNGEDMMVSLFIYLLIYLLITFWFVSAPFEYTAWFE